MLITKLSKIVLVGISVLLLSACSTTGNKKGGAPVVDASNADANSMGAGDATTFGANGADNGKALQVANQSYFFEFDKSDVNQDDMASIKVQADYLAANPDSKVRLEGNTDNRGSREYNIALGNRRADSVAKALESYGVGENQLKTVSYGAEKPRVAGNDEEAWQQNRRVDLAYQTPIK